MRQDPIMNKAKPSNFEVAMFHSKINQINGAEVIDFPDSYSMLLPYVPFLSKYSRSRSRI